MRVALSGVLVLVLAGCAGSGGSGGSTSCAATVRWRSATYEGHAGLRNVPAGRLLGSGVLPACRDTDGASAADEAEPVKLRAIRGVIPASPSSPSTVDEASTPTAASAAAARSTPFYGACAGANDGARLGACHLGRRAGYRLCLTAAAPHATAAQPYGSGPCLSVVWGGTVHLPERPATLATLANHCHSVGMPFPPVSRSRDFGSLREQPSNRPQLADVVAVPFPRVGSRTIHVPVKEAPHFVMPSQERLLGCDHLNLSFGGE